MSGSLILTPSVVTLFLLWNYLVQLLCHGFLFYLIILYLVFFFLLEACLFPMKDRKGIYSGERGDVKEQGGVEGGKIVIRIKCVRKEIYF